MINKDMNSKSTTVRGQEKSTGRKPNENAGFYFSSSVKIFDPNTQQILVQKRGDV
jgi:hypothetical protein